jgi:hypothetical protein
MERVIPSGRLYRLPGHLDGDQDSLPLEPFRSQPILVIGPFSFGDDAPGRRLQHHRPISEFVTKCSAEHLSTNVKLSEMWS